MASLVGAGYKPTRAKISFLTGMVGCQEVFSGDTHKCGGTASHAMAFAGGAMLFVISDEVVGDPQRRLRRASTYSLIVGLYGSSGQPSRVR